MGNVSGFNTGITFNDATAWATPALWFDHAIHVKHCNKSCPLRNDLSLSIWHCDLSDIFLHFNDQKYLELYKSMMGKEFNRELTRTYKDMTYRNLELLNSMQAIITAAKESELSNVLRHISYSIISSTFCRDPCQSNSV